METRSSLIIALLSIALLLPERSFGQVDSVTTGVASYYANKFEGRKTSSGELFRQDSLTAAHKTLPFGTLVKVTNLSNDSTVVVKINDRLPKSSSRSIDLSLRAAKQLNFVRKGLTQVRIEVLPPVREEEQIVPEE
jgi:rare lipoprotein A